MSWHCITIIVICFSSSQSECKMIVKIHQSSTSKTQENKKEIDFRNFSPCKTQFFRRVYFATKIAYMQTAGSSQSEISALLEGQRGVQRGRSTQKVYKSSRYTIQMVMKSTNPAFFFPRRTLCSQKRVSRAIRVCSVYRTHCPSVKGISMFLL